MPELGHEPTFSAPWITVGFPPETRHSAPSVGNGFRGKRAKKLAINIESGGAPCTCPLVPRARTLGYFYDHLAKGIYAEACNWDLPRFAAEGAHARDRDFGIVLSWDHAQRCTEALEHAESEPDRHMPSTSWE